MPKYGGDFNREQIRRQEEESAAIERRMTGGRDSLRAWRGAIDGVTFGTLVAFAIFSSAIAILTWEGTYSIGEALSWAVSLFVYLVVLLVLRVVSLWIYAARASSLADKCERYLERSKDGRAGRLMTGADG